MVPFREGLSRALALLLLLLLLPNRSWAQEFGDECLAKFKPGREDFILDTDESVNGGATFISPPKVETYRDCVVSCCKDPKCNVAFMQSGTGEGSVDSCFLFDCLYKKKYVCRFVRKRGYFSYILESLYDSYLEVHTPRNEEDRPPVADAGPDRVVQPQDSVSLNGIESKDDIEIVSYQWLMVSGSPTAIIAKTDFEDQVNVSNLTSGVYKFQLTVTDSSGQSDSTQITILVLTPEQSEDHCMVPMKIGPCRGSFPRWHYNGASEKCEEFNFGGCRGNRNNYLTLKECSNACSGSGGEKSGRGLPIPAAKGETCGVTCTPEQFTCANGCCLDPGLECDKEKQCSDGSDEAKCEDLTNKFRILLEIQVNQQKERCTQPPETGSCRDSLTRWYYNPFQQACLRFNYGGCKGNENRFDSEDACMKTCRGVTDKDVFATGEFDRSVADNHAATIAIAAVLALAIVILLCILVYCMVKGKKQTQQHQRLPANNAQVTSLEDRERLVYNPTTKSI
ncbi:kunitz-type protease inhibitor 1a isoform X2 [Genypterus blacodes]|uniref:kunitz-type protease inhibitor 1a isoform X2 n=1 Tax=Genypterus blacodes TaxID=154954 RepID=UPI003F7638AE